MSNGLVDVPPEVLVNILSFLPIQALLRFSQCSTYTHSLATSSLHTLSLAIHTTPVARLISSISATRYPEPKHSPSKFYFSAYPPTSTNQYQKDLQESAEAELACNGPYNVSVSIPDAQTYDASTLILFHTSLMKSILFRHGNTLRNLDISLWTLTIPVAKALAALRALRVLSVRIDDFPHIRAMPRRLVGTQRAEQREAWGIVAETAIWAPRLQALRIEGGELNSSQLFTLLRKSRWCQELWLCKCSSIGKELWNFLGNEWEYGRASLRILGIMRCGGQLDEGVMDLIGGLKGLQVSSPLTGSRVSATTWRGSLTGPVPVLARVLWPG
jgi:hypothetical protein